MIFEIFPKLNIFLKILEFKGSYHRLFSRFVLARGELKDMASLKLGDRFSLQGDFGCPLEENLIWKAILKLEEFLKSQHKDTSGLKNLCIEVQKGIPKGGGLGGGSADAGVILRKINEFFDFGLSMDELNLIGSKVGSDVAFFVSGFQSANVSGFGEVLEAFDEKEYDFEILSPKIFCDTKSVYAQYDRSAQNSNDSLKFWEQRGRKSEEFLSLYTKEELNDLFLPATCIYPELREISDELGEEWFFSGSGSSFFRLRTKDTKECPKKEAK